MATKQCQVIAIEKSVKTRVDRYVTEAYKNIQKPQLFDGLTKTFEKRDEDGEDFPTQRQLVKLRANDVFQGIAEQLTELIDLVATKDAGNCVAQANVTVDDNVLLADVPVTHLLFLEKKLVDLGTVIDNLPTLDSAYDWHPDSASGLHKAEPVTTTHMKKIHKPLTLYEATTEHPAQVQLIQVDENIGTWTTTKQSGAVTVDRKKALQKRVRKLHSAVKVAREEANSVEVTPKSYGASLFEYLLK